MEIKFYILETTETQQAWLFVCQLAESLYQKKQLMHIKMNNLEDAKRLDQLLWTYRDDSFVPHQILKEKEENSCPILILTSANENADVTNRMLINLCDDMPRLYQNYHQVIEIVYNQSSQQQGARMRYKKYRDAGHSLQTIRPEDIKL